MSIGLGSYLPWRISGTYLEACNCEAICPCRTIGGRKGGRSTYGECVGSLSWQIEEGKAGAVDLGGMRAVLANRYGREVVAELLSVQDGPLEFELSAKCGYEATFGYSSEIA